MPDPQIYCFPAKRTDFPVVLARGISFLRDLEEQDTDGKLSAVTLQEHIVPVVLPPSWNSSSGYT